MASKLNTLIGRWVQKGALVRWGIAARNAPHAPLDVLRKQRHRARRLRALVDELTYIADSRLALPRIGANAFSRPGGTEWSWRPQLWRGPLGQKGMSAVPSKAVLGDEVTLFHDCKISELTLRQVRNTREQDLAPFGLRMDVFQFDGSFLSLVLDAPSEASVGLQRRHIIRLNAIIEVEKPLEVFARLNIKHGPNTEKLVLELPLGQDEVMVEFDLGYSEINEKRIERVWLDLIFESPEMNQITVRDLTFCRYPRAEI
ncbi:DUF6478 family protein [Yoonia sp. MH D7]